MSGEFCTHLSVQTLAIAHTAVVSELAQMRRNSDKYGPTALSNRMFNGSRVAAVQIRRQLGYTDSEGMAAHGARGMA